MNHIERFYGTIERSPVDRPAFISQAAKADVGLSINLDPSIYDIVPDSVLLSKCYPYLFCIDNVLYASWSEHPDSMDEYHPVDGFIRSTDKGLTWTDCILCPDSQDNYIVAMAKAGSKLIALSFLNYRVTGYPDQVGIYQWESTNGGVNWTRYYKTIILPQNPRVDVYTPGNPLIDWSFSHNIVKDGNGYLYATMYGQYAGDYLGRKYINDWQFRTILVRSTDNGVSWQYYSQIALGHLPETGEKYCEPTIEICNNGSWLCVMRTGNTYVGYPPYDTAYPLYQSRSTDTGLTWASPQKIVVSGVSDDYELSSVAPKLLKLSNGMLVLGYGRPDNKLVFSQSGNGDDWNDLTHVYDGDCYNTSGMLGVNEVEPGKLIVIGDKGPQGWGSAKTTPYGIWRRYVYITKKEFIT